jgi:DNA-binding MarR family transcriptional regulator
MTDEVSQLKSTLQQIVSLLSMLDDTEKSCCGVTLAQCHALYEIGEAGSLSLVELTEKMKLDKSTLSRTVDQLVTKGYCQRIEHSGDRRYIVIKLTGQGGILYNEVRQNVDASFETIYNSLPAGKREQVLDSARLLLDAVQTAGCCNFKDVKE